MTIAAWTNIALSRLSGALPDVVTAELVETIDEFCRRSTAWREMVYALDITANVREITPVIGDGSKAEVLGILRVYYNQNRMGDYSHVPFEAPGDLHGSYTARSDSPNIINLSSIPINNQTGVIDTLVYAKPVNAASYIPAVLSDQFYDFILDGLLGRMYAHQGRPYTNDALAVAFTRKFSADVKSARDMANRGFTANAQNWTFPIFGR